MISLAITPAVAGRPNTDIIGPYSPWPRRKPRSFARPAIYVGGTGLVGVIVHCAPLLMA